MVSSEYRNRPELESWQRDILDAFYTLTKSRQSGFDTNPVSFTDMTMMIAVNPALGFYEPLEMIGFWQDLDMAMREYWQTKRVENEKRKKELMEKAGKN